MYGYGGKTEHVFWPDEARVAVQFVINYEEGGENCLLHGDQGSEAFLSEIIGASPWPGKRHWNMESLYEYGARAGYWRLYDAFQEAEIPATVFGVATALARSPEQVSSMLEANWEIASHGYKWIEYKDFTVEREREHLNLALELHTQVVGERPLGWYTGRCSENTVRLVAEHGGFRYMADSYADDLPYWMSINDQNHLIVPYALDTNDMRFATNQGFNTGEDFYCYLKDSFDVLYQEGEQGKPKMMSVGLHCRLAGRPGRMAGLKRFIDHICSKDGVWIPTRLALAEHWHAHFGPAKSLQPSTMTKSEFMEHFGGIFEDAPRIASRTFGLELGPAHNSSVGMYTALCRTFRSESREDKLKILKNHPDLAGKLAVEGKLGRSSSEEQKSAGLDALDPEELKLFAACNAEYRQKFGFPFIIAVKDTTKADILASMPTRLNRSVDEEFDEACRQVERIAWYRVQAKFRSTQV